MKKITGVVLCGGRSSRMGGTPKGLLDLNGKTFVERVAEVLSNVCDEVVLSANIPQYREFPYPNIADKYPNQGPLGGIRSVIEHTESDSYLFIPCDMPLVDEALLQDMVQSSNNCEAVVPALGEEITSMPLLLKQSTLPLIETMILEGNRKVFNLINYLSYRTVQWREGIVNPEVCKNINTQEDLQGLLNLSV